ncbi:MAG TPA: ROK family transcriptional regulator [Thermoleophilaceae bacterium]|nr:ROK family transcriptional regulator [Thermoleophilaceae bacterium]
MRELNRSRVIEALRELGVASRADVARHTGLSRTTISGLVAEMRDEGLVVDRPGPDGDAPASGAGRPPTPIGLSARAGAALGIDFGKRHLAVVVADLSHTLLAEDQREMEEGYDSAAGIDAAIELVEDVLARAGIPVRQLLGVGVGLPGPVHGPSGQVGSSAILPGWEGLQVAREMEGRLGVPVRVDNDANLGALAELFWGAGEGAADLVYLKVATGIGAGLIFQGRLFHGAGGTAGEIGHLTIDEHGPMCRCGNRGCLETFAAGDALVELLRSSLGHELTAEEIVDQAIAGDVACRRAIADAGRHLGHAVGAICNLINPSRVVVGGSIGQAGDLLLGEMREAVRRRAVLSAAQDVEIVAGVLGERAEVLGAVALVLGDAEAAPVPEAVTT